METGQKAEKFVAGLTGEKLSDSNKKSLEDADKSAEGAMARFSANLDNMRDKLALAGGGFTQMKGAMETTIKNLATLADVANGVQTPMEKLDDTMLMLAKAVQANTDALTGKKAEATEGGNTVSKWLDQKKDEISHMMFKDAWARKEALEHPEVLTSHQPAPSWKKTVKK